MTNEKDSGGGDFIAEDLLALAEFDLYPSADQLGLATLATEAEELARAGNLTEAARADLVRRAMPLCNGNEIAIADILEELEELDPTLPPLLDENGEPLPI